MFSKGQIIFMIVFVIVFATALVWAYRSDRTDIRKYYPGAWKVIIMIVVILAAMVYILRLIRKL